MFSLKNIIFDLYGSRDRKNDINKDVNYKGLHQRFNELLAGDLDDNEINLINKIVENTVNPATALVRFLPNLEYQFGIPAFNSNDDMRRKFLCYIIRLNPYKGTKLGYIYMLRLLGFSGANFIEHSNNFGFDSPITFDDPVRFFDMGCRGCSDYEIDVLGTLTLTPALTESIKAIIKYNEPINADLISLKYNGVTIPI